jgi:hypothetical protein
MPALRLRNADDLVLLGSGTVQNPLDLPMSNLRQRFAETVPAANNTVNASRERVAVKFESIE